MRQISSSMTVGAANTPAPASPNAFSSALSSNSPAMRGAISWSSNQSSSRRRRAEFNETGAAGERDHRPQVPVDIPELDQASTIVERTQIGIECCPSREIISGSSATCCPRSIGHPPLEAALSSQEPGLIDLISRIEVCGHLSEIGEQSAELGILRSSDRLEAEGGRTAVLHPLPHPARVGGLDGQAESPVSNPAPVSRETGTDIGRSGRPLMPSDVPHRSRRSASGTGRVTCLRSDLHVGQTEVGVERQRQ